MKIAYITLHKVRNYGSVLQAYATQRVFKEMGKDVVLINYCSPRFSEENRIKDEFERFRYKNKNNFIVKKMFHLIMSFSLRKQRKQFEHFISHKIQCTDLYKSIEELRESPPTADVYCTGSDQVWNIKTNGFFERPFYLDFGDENIKRIAFSASFGRNVIETDEMKLISHCLKRYSGIGIRESSGLSILEKIGIDKIENTLDPTLVLESDKWFKLTDDERPFKDKYILIYEFNKTSNIGLYARRLSEKTGLPVKRITYWYHEHHKNEQCIVVPTVEQFLTLIRHAEYVITNSFHASVFSTVFRKQFAVVYPKHFSVRLADYLKLIGVPERCVDEVDDIVKIQEYIDFDKIHSILDDERNKTIKFLQKILN